MSKNTGKWVDSLHSTPELRSNSSQDGNHPDDVFTDVVSTPSHLSEIYLEDSLCQGKRRCRFSFGICLFLVFIVSLATLGVVLATDSILFSWLSTKTLVNERQAIIGNFAHSMAKDWLEQAPELCEDKDRIDVFFNSNGSSEGDNVRDMQFNLYHMLKGTTNIFETAIGITNGASLGASIDHRLWWNDEKTKHPWNGGNCCNYSNYPPPGPTHNSWFDPKTLEIIKRTTIGNGRPFDFRTLKNGWWSRGIENESFQWNNFLTGSNILASTCTKKWYLKNGTFQGVVAVWVILAQFEYFLDILQPLVPGSIYVVSVLDGTLLASTHKDTITYLVGENGRKERMVPEESPNKEISSVSRFILSKYGKWENVPTTSNKPISADSIGKLVTTELVTVKGNFSILWIYYESTYSIYKNAFWLFMSSNVINFSIFLFTIPVMSIILCCMMKPLKNLQRDMKKLEDMDLDNVVIRTSIFKEFNSLYQNFHALVSRLKQFRVFIPQVVLKPLPPKQEVQHDETPSISSNDSSISHEKTMNSTTSSSKTCESVRSLKSIFTDRFSVGLVKNYLTVLYIRLFEVEDKFGVKDHFYEAYSRLIDGLDSLLSQSRGKLMNFQIDFVIITYEDANIALRDSFKVGKLLEQMESRFGGNGSRVVVHTRHFFSGILGSSKQRKPMLCVKHGVFENVAMIANERTFRDIRVCVCHSVVDNPFDRDESFIILPFDITCEDENGKLIPLYWLIGCVEKKQDEWLYELKNHKKRSQFDFLYESYVLFCEERFEESIKLLKEHLGVEKFDPFSIDLVMDPLDLRRIVQMTCKIFEFVQKNKIFTVENEKLKDITLHSGESLMKKLMILMDDGKGESANEKQSLKV